MTGIWGKGLILQTPSSVSDSEIGFKQANVFVPIKVNN
jgi:hypothetical protein